MKGKLLRRYALVFVLLSIAAAALVELAERDRLSSAIEDWAVLFLGPGFLLRGLASQSELGFHDWRDVVLTALGSAGAFTAIFALLDGVYRRRRKPDAPVV